MLPDVPGGMMLSTSRIESTKVSKSREDWDYMKSSYTFGFLELKFHCFDFAVVTFHKSVHVGWGGLYRSRKRD